MVALADVKRLVTYIAWLWHYIAPCQGNFLPLPGKKRHVGRKKEKQQEEGATRRRRKKKEREVERKRLLSLLLFTLHQIVWNPDKHWGSERWRVGLTSSPLFTTLHLRQEDKRWAAYLSRSSVIIEDQRWSSMMTEAGSKEWSRSLKKYRVKRGEEWWRVPCYSSRTQSSYIQLVMLYLWRVKSVFESSSLFIKRSKTPSENVRDWAKSP